GAVGVGVGALAGVVDEAEDVTGGVGEVVVGLPPSRHGVQGARRFADESGVDTVRGRGGQTERRVVEPGRTELGAFGVAGPRVNQVVCPAARGDPGQLAVVGPGFTRAWSVVGGSGLVAELVVGPAGGGAVLHGQLAGVVVRVCGAAGAGVLAAVLGREVAGLVPAVQPRCLACAGGVGLESVGEAVPGVVGVAGLEVAAAARRSAGVRGAFDHFGALGFLQGLLTVLRDSGHGEPPGAAIRTTLRR